MRTALALALLALLLGGCQPPREGCGLIGCITTGHVKARGRDLVGADVRQAIGVMGGAPDSSYRLDARTEVLTWTRQQDDRSFGLFVCTESLTVASGIVVKHAERGSCG
jgi:hypothetical protein